MTITPVSTTPDALDSPDTSAAPVGPAEGGSTPPTGGGVPHAGLRLTALIAATVALGVWRPWILAMIAALVLMITLHEWGHYITAKRSGMKVTEFFLFFGPKVWSIQRGETEYGIKCIPAGAYVKIIGMSNLDVIAPEDEERTYRQKPFMSRISVAVAGSTMHFLLALVLIFVALSVVGQPGGTVDQSRQAKNWRIGSVAEGTGAAAAGLKEGDKLVTVNGERISTFDDLPTVAKPLKGTTVPVTYERNGKLNSVDVTLKPFYTWRIDRVIPGSTVEKAGLKAGDEILSLDGASVRHSKDLDEKLAALEGKTVPVVYETLKDDKTQTTKLKVSSLILFGHEGYLGIGSDEPPKKRLSPLEGLRRTPVEFANVLTTSLASLGHLLSPSGITSIGHQVGSARSDAAATSAAAKRDAAPTGNQSTSFLTDGGPSAPSANRPISILGLVSFGATLGKVEPAALISLFALINIFIGMFNLVPLLPLDGGHVAIAVYERIQEKRLNRRRYFTDMAKLMPLTMVVIGVLAVLFLSTIYLDIANPLVAR